MHDTEKIMCINLYVAYAYTLYWCRYSGESNTYNHESYGCAVQQMVEDWRASWFANTPTMDEQFPFGQVQVPYNICIPLHH